MAPDYQSGGGRPVGAVRSHLSLVRWLGPWAGATRRPRVAREPIELGGGPAPLRAYLYRPRRRPRAVYLLAPGLHYAGPDDPRMDRFCAILAASGAAVVAPFLPDFCDLAVTPRVVDDFGRALDGVAALDLGVARPRLFSISFGSLPALRLAAARSDEVDGLVVFGGYAEFSSAMRFCLTGQRKDGRPATRDPLNQSVLYMNLLDHMPEAPAEHGDLRAAWRRYVVATWGRAEMKRDQRFAAVARAHADELPARLRDFFLLGCGALPGSAEVALAALGRYDAGALDPRPHLPAITCPVDLVHGADDDVIPSEHAPELAAAMTGTAARVHVTGMYGHTGHALPSPRAVLREIATMGRILGVLGRAARP